MTFSLAAKCERTGALGVLVPSSSVCVTSRCAEVRAGAGAVASQNITDPALGELGLELLRRGDSANRVLTELVEAGDYPEHRQIAVVDGSGHTAHHSGSNTRSATPSPAAGSASRRVIYASIKRFRRPWLPRSKPAPTRSLPNGCFRPSRPAKNPQAKTARCVPRLSRWEDLVWPTVDARVDWHDTPNQELRRIWSVLAPQKRGYVTRTQEPTAAPSYGVPGDPRRGSKFVENS